MWFTWQEINAFSQDSVECCRFKENLINWAISWNLYEEWILSSAMLTIVPWYRNLTLKEKCIVHPSG